MLLHLVRDSVFTASSGIATPMEVKTFEDVRARQPATTHLWYIYAQRNFR